MESGAFEMVYSGLGMLCVISYFEMVLWYLLYDNSFYRSIEASLVLEYASHISIYIHNVDFGTTGYAAGKFSRTANTSTVPASRRKAVPPVPKKPALADRVMTLR